MAAVVEDVFDDPKWEIPGRLIGWLVMLILDKLDRKFNANT